MFDYLYIIFIKWGANYQENTAKTSNIWFSKNATFKHWDRALWVKLQNHISDNINQASRVLYNVWGGEELGNSYGWGRGGVSMFNEMFIEMFIDIFIVLNDVALCCMMIVARGCIGSCCCNNFKFNACQWCDYCTEMTRNVSYLVVSWGAGVSQVLLIVLNGA